MTPSELIFTMAEFAGGQSQFGDFTAHPGIGLAIKALTGCDLSSATVYNDGRIEVRSYGPSDAALLRQHFTVNELEDKGYKGIVVEILPAA